MTAGQHQRTTRNLQRLCQQLIYHQDKPPLATPADFRSIFGADPDTCAIIWHKIEHRIKQLFQKFSDVSLKHLLWGLYFLNHYCTERLASATFRTTPKTFRKWSKMIVIQISHLYKTEVSARTIISCHY